MVLQRARRDWATFTSLHFIYKPTQFCSVQFSRSAVSDSLWPHESQNTRPPCPSPTPRIYSNSCPSSRWCHPAISSSVIPFSSCPQSLPAPGSFPRPWCPWTGHGTTDWFQTGKGVRQGCILSPCLFNLYAEYIMRNAGLEEAHTGIKIGGRNINNLRYADDTTLMAERVAKVLEAKVLEFQL